MSWVHQSLNACFAFKVMVGVKKEKLHLSADLPNLYTLDNKCVQVTTDGEFRSGGPSPLSPGISVRNNVLQGQCRKQCEKPMLW